MPTTLGGLLSSPMGGLKAHTRKKKDLSLRFYQKLQIEVKQDANKVHLLRTKVIPQNYSKFIKLWLKYNKLINRLFSFLSVRRWP